MPLGYKEPPEGLPQQQDLPPADIQGEVERAASDQPDWHLPPEAADEPGGFKAAEMREIVEKAWERPLWKEGYISRHDEVRYTGGEGWRFFWKPLWMTLGFGVPGWLLIIGQLWEPELSAALGSPFGRQDGLVRLGMLLLGGFLLFAAAPLYKPTEWTPRQQRAIDRDREYFRSKRHT